MIKHRISRRLPMLALASLVATTLLLTDGADAQIKIQVKQIGQAQVVPAQAQVIQRRAIQRQGIQPGGKTTSSITLSKIVLDGETVSFDLEIPIPNKRVTEAYTVKVPVAKPDGTITYREETRSRVVQATEKKRVPAQDLFEFRDLAGKVMDIETVAKHVPAEGLTVVLSNSPTIPPSWKAVLKEGTIVMLRARKQRQPS